MRDAVVRSLGAVTLCALVSLWVQIDGLIGSRGVLPFDAFLRRRAVDPWWHTPTLFWWWQTDTALHVALALGCLLAIALIAGVRLQGPLLLGLWAIYLSLAHVGQDFLGFQWDTLLTETLFASLFVARWQVRRERAPSLLGVWILRWTLFKLMLASGLVKLTSGDTTWWDGSAMAYHYWTQPIPNPISWYAHHLPAWFHQLETYATLFIEIALPFAIFFRAGRRVAFVGFTLVLALLFLTGNYGFFQWLSMVLVLSLLEPDRSRKTPRAGWLATTCCGAWLVFTVVLGTAHSYGRVFDYRELPRPALELVKGAYPWRTVNAYGLFARMTTDRHEVWVEGTADGQTWERYTFPYKPGPLDRAPPVLGLHMPRLDWQLWFAALRPCERSPWLSRLLLGLKQGEPVVTGLLAHNPLPDGALRVRTRIARTTFTDAGPAWWASGPARPHCRAR